MTRSGQASARLYSRLLLLYPASHRVEYGALMSQLFEDQLLAARRHGGRRALVALWGRVLLDTVCNASLEHLDRWSEPMRNGSRIVLAAAAAVLVVPFTFVVLNLLEYGLHLSIPWNPHDLLWPQIRFTSWRYLYDAVIVLSAPLALGLLFARQLQLRWRPQADALAWVVIRKGDRIGLALMALCLLLMASMGLYFIGENLPCFLGRQIAC